MEPSIDVWRYDARTATAAAGVVTEALVEACDIRRSSDVLDLACGGGNPSVHIASAVATHGTVVAADIDLTLLSVVASINRLHGLPNLLPCACRSDRLPFEPGRFDAVTCRFGVMFFPDVASTLGELHRVMRHDARVAFSVFGPKRCNSVYALIEAAFNGLGIAAAASSRTLFRFCGPHALAQELAAAGFRATADVMLRGDYADPPEVQVRHALNTTYSREMSLLDAAGARAFLHGLQVRLRQAQAAGTTAWQYRVIVAQR